MRAVVNLDYRTERIQLNGTTPVTVLGPPGNAQFMRCTCIRVPNTDNAVVDLVLKKVIAGVATQEEKVTALAVDAVWTPVDENRPLSLGTTKESLTIQMGAPAGLSNPYVDIQWQVFPR